MNANQLQQEISIIKEMIDKTRKSTAESGHLLVYIGILSALATIAIGLLGIYGLNEYILPAVGLLAVVNGFIGYRINVKYDTATNVATYPKTLFWNIWMVCGTTTLLIVFLFPFLGLYPFGAIPVIVSLVMGIGIFSTGLIFELKFIQWASLAWYIGACLMAISEGPVKLGIMVLIIIIGWIVPGLYLNKLYKERSTK